MNFERQKYFKHNSLLHFGQVYLFETYNTVLHDSCAQTFWTFFNFELQLKRLCSSIYILLYVYKSTSMFISIWGTIWIVWSQTLQTITLLSFWFMFLHLWASIWMWLRQKYWLQQPHWKGRISFCWQKLQCFPRFSNSINYLYCFRRIKLR